VGGSLVGAVGAGAAPGPLGPRATMVQAAARLWRRPLTTRTPCRRSPTAPTPSCRREWRWCLAGAGARARARRGCTAGATSRARPTTPACRRCRPPWRPLSWTAWRTTARWARRFVAWVWPPAPRALGACGPLRRGRG
jgi:hypothetical protein